MIFILQSWSLYFDAFCERVNFQIIAVLNWCKKPWPQNKLGRAAQKICGLVVRRGLYAQYITPNHELYLKWDNTKKMFLQHMTSRRSVTLNYFQTGWRILFTTFLETKTQLWKLM